MLVNLPFAKAICSKDKSFLSLSKDGLRETLSPYHNKTSYWQDKEKLQERNK